MDHDAGESGGRRRSVKGGRAWGSENVTLTVTVNVTFCD